MRRGESERYICHLNLKKNCSRFTKLYIVIIFGYLTIYSDIILRTVNFLCVNSKKAAFDNKTFLANYLQQVCAFSIFPF